MKRFCLLLLLSFIVLPASAKNKIKMVTYFPVPYVAYSQINATESLDIGLTSVCDMKLGCTESPVTLNATKVNLESGRLDLNGGRGILGGSITLGSGNGTGNIKFNKVRIETGKMESVHAQEMNVNTLKLFGKDFPSCKEKESSGQMSWKSLKLQGATAFELYLACGDAVPAAADCSDSAYKSAHKGECCPSMPESDEVCYMDCSEEEKWEWSDTSATVEQFLGADWQRRALHPSVTGSGATLCPVPDRDSPNWNTTGVTVRSELLNTQDPELRNWDIWALADSLGSSRLENIIAASTLNRKLCEEKMPCERINNNIFCLILFADSKLHWCYASSYSDFDTDLYQDYSYHLWECKSVPGVEKRCKNGW